MHAHKRKFNTTQRARKTNLLHNDIRQQFLFIVCSSGNISCVCFSGPPETTDKVTLKFMKFRHCFASI